MAPVDEILRYVGYEWWMFRATRSLILNGAPGAHRLVVHNAASDSNFVHARVLAHFFFTTGQAHDDDWTADNLGMARLPLPPALSELCRHVNKRVVHLTEGRVSLGFDYPNPLEVHQRLEDRIAALKSTLGDTIPPKWLGDFPVP